MSTVATVQLPDGQQVRLGRIRPSLMVQTDKYLLREYSDGSHKLTLKFGHYYDAAADKVQPVLATNWREKAAPSLSRMYLNNQLGDCVIAGKYHSVGVWTGNDSPSGAAVGTDAEVLQQYHAICGPGDNGCVITKVLDVMKSHGLPLGGVLHKIDDYVSVDWTNKLLMQVALEEFGTVTLGINLPQEWLQAPNGGTWDLTTSAIVGGHDVTACDYSQDGVWVATWGGTRLITWRAMASRTWVEEADVPLSPDWYGSDSLAPNGINVAQLKADLAKLGGGIIPDPGPTPVPPPAVDLLTLTTAEAAGTYTLPFGLGSLMLGQSYGPGTYAVGLTLGPPLASLNILTLNAAVPAGTYSLPVGSLTTKGVAAGTYGMTLTPVKPPPDPPPGPTPIPPSPADVITLTQAVKAGQYVRFKTAKPAGAYIRSASTGVEDVGAMEAE